MHKLLPGKLVIASHNAGKVREIRALLQPFGIEPVSAASLDLPEPEETGVTFAANALLKAVSSCDLSGMVALADDHLCGNLDEMGSGFRYLPRTTGRIGTGDVEIAEHTDVDGAG